MHDYRISIIMPALNEELALENSIRNVLDSFSRSGINGELVVVNDGSSDSTGSLAEAWASSYDNIKVLHHDRPMGIGASFWDGIHHARGEIVTWLPGDGENDAAEILRYLPLLDQVDIVVPFVYNPGVRPWRRRLLSFAYHQIIYLTTAYSLNYLNGTVMYRRSIFEGITLNSTGFFYQTELLIKTIGRHYLYAEVPYALKKRDGGKSKATTLKSLISVASGYLNTLRDVYALRIRPARISEESVTARRHREQAEAEKGKTP
jgi:glycosyltransferase involved in cell wall biosynthesis